MERMAWVLIIVGALLMFGCGVYYSFNAFFIESDSHLIVKIGVPTLIAGSIFLLLVALQARLRGRHLEDFRKDDA